jgi:DNA-directed RNA polymerase subunit RPC12/RpoP
MISRIPNPDFVRCRDCSFRRVRKELITTKTVRVYYCVRTGKKLRGKRGCEQGQRKKRLKQETLE